MASDYSMLYCQSVSMDKERTHPIGGNYRRRELDLESIKFEDFYNPWNFFHLLSQDDNFVNEWLMKNGLLARSLPCTKSTKIGEDLYGNEIMADCPGTLKASQRAGKASGSSLRCDKNRNHEKTIRINSFFEGSKLTIQDIFVFVKCYLDKNSLYLCSRSSGINYKTTAVDWASFVRELFKEYYHRFIRNKQLKGIVEIDESLFGRRVKYHKGDPRKGLRVWVFGMVERSTGTLIVYPVADRRQETLLPLIQRHVQPGSTIYSDGWSAYCCLNDLGYTHFTVIHKYAFKKQYKNVATGEITNVHTNTIEGAWQHAKNHFRNLAGTKATQWEGHLAEVMWRAQLSGSVYDSFFSLVKMVYTLEEPPRYFYTTPLFDSWTGIDNIEMFNEMQVQPALSDADSTDPESDVDDASMKTASVTASGATVSAATPDVICISTDEEPPTLQPATMKLLSDLFSNSSISGDDTIVEPPSTSTSKVHPEKAKDSAKRVQPVQSSRTKRKEGSSKSKSAQMKTDKVCHPPGFVELKKDSKFRSSARPKQPSNPYSRKNFYTWSSSGDDFV